MQRAQGEVAREEVELECCGWVIDAVIEGGGVNI